LLECAEISGLHFGTGILWHKKATDCILEAFNAYKMERFGYELEVREKLSNLWHLIADNNQELLNRHTVAHPDTVRLKKMLAYIHTNYADQITLSDIAKVANIGERECLRCFKRTIGSTPMKYLARYRISMAARMLAKTNLTVTEISRQTGFESPSYFSLTFKRFMEITPKEYRQGIKH